MRLLLSIASLTMVLAGCGGGPSSAPPAPPAPQEAIARMGDLTVRASALPTSSLTPQVAQRYGINRDEHTVMLLVGLRRGAEGQETAVQAQIKAAATNLTGQRQDLSLRELRSGEWIDYVGTVQTTPPETLRFDVEVTAEGGGHATMQFSREIYPQ
ncbi:DUF4426 domain-containing protein [Lysobacter tyrosinilyticus]